MVVGTVSLSTPLGKVIGKAKPFEEKLGLRTVDDLLRHYPRRYARRGELTDLAGLRVGEEVTVLARVKTAAVISNKTRPGHRLQVIVTDGTGELMLTFFGKKPQLDWRANQLRNRVGLFSGTVDVFNKKRQLVHPDFHPLDEEDDDEAHDYASRLIRIYPAAAGIESWKVSRALDTLLTSIGELTDPLPDELRRAHGLVGFTEALHLVHRPKDDAEVKRGRKRLRYDEAFVLQTVLAQRRAEAAGLPAISRVPADDGLVAAFDERLPFTLTAGQQEVSTAIAADLAREHPMHRLLQGEVGSGKTVVALRAMLTVVDSGGQAALLAPTEVLAQQHYRSITALLGPLAERGLLGGSDVGTRVALLTGSQSTGVRRANLLDVVSGDAGIVIGTHALIQDTVDFHDLGLVVVDEQHRFGVEQRDALRGKAKVPPHVLVMTATPIPRTVAMTVFGDLDVSTLTELPAGRSPIASHVVPAGEKPHFLDRAWARVREEVERGHQVYVVCPRIGGTDDEPASGAEPDLDGESETRPLRPALAVLDVAPMLADGPLAGLRVEVLHGRMAADAKDDVMSRFAVGQIDVLVATTVVEVGVDVPNATVMVILDAERFGVSQLHQMRGRVGRGSAPGLCLLVTDAEAGTPSRDRLEAVAATSDGFELAQLDLETRREGDVLGASQSGRRSSLRLLSVLRDEKLIVQARDDATAVVAADPDLAGHPVLRAAVEMQLADQRADYLDKA